MPCPVFLTVSDSVAVEATVDAGKVTDVVPTPLVGAFPLYDAADITSLLVAAGTEFVPRLADSMVEAAKANSMLNESTTRTIVATSRACFLFRDFIFVISPRRCP